ncbi:hypothetical protein A3A71_00205 [Candidatus Berkelbacteria bacterium RIFCSPLOWO2_01_FULL_50_28]|uniref:Uncharacterized protein n=1 Tax=Candidatus Berkelbacteria bacterium RIFCSPLOWO2_01_FULL_50_28 TaxID=1797471 RepID=A0A1F5EAS2_9BACT|nr:MAG: hypothetical protein A2807_00135 [Candidatus Berkelbacteria bacterium RIFCSPHIGHO2_01_FULL_50_36]OGD62817.1 MAG: hypothetical protein A3F39_02205 [Candidatus Berkelbacteria bacterium RIFCSPHIGHO2_12_FULL_50_11]OGD64473.1 MAG: hypothetical protein A3A71_00205 [Candidatus Berkelbacteria bacterium RIFCSPLOWO2_01_FULL_50_28]
MADDDNSLVDESHFPLRSVLPPMDVEEVLKKDILELIGASGLTKEKKAQIYENMGKTIENRVIARVADLLSDEEMEKFISLSQTNPEQAVELLKANEIDMPKFIAEEALLYKTQLVTLFQAR